MYRKCLDLVLDWNWIENIRWHWLNLNMQRNTTGDWIWTGLDSSAPISWIDFVPLCIFRNGNKFQHTTRGKQIEHKFVITDLVIVKLRCYQRCNANSTSLPNSSVPARSHCSVSMSTSTCQQCHKVRRGSRWTTEALTQRNSLEQFHRGL